MASTYSRRVRNGEKRLAGGWLATAETGSGIGNCIMVRLGAREIVKLNNKAQKMRQR